MWSGLAVEAVITLLPIPVLPFFILLFIIGVSNKISTYSFTLMQTKQTLPYVHSLLKYCRASTGTDMQCLSTMFQGVFVLSCLQQRMQVCSLFSPLIAQMLTLTFVVPFTFGILIAWIALSCITIPLFQWFVRRHNWTSSLNAAASVPPSRGLDHRKPPREAESDTRDSEKAEWLVRSGCLVCVHPLLLITRLIPDPGFTLNVFTIVSFPLQVVGFTFLPLSSSNVVYYNILIPKVVSRRQTHLGNNYVIISIKISEI